MGLRYLKACSLKSNRLTLDSVATTSAKFISILSELSQTRDVTDSKKPQEWFDIKSSLRETVCQRLASDAYEASKQGQLDVIKLIEDIDKLAERSARLADSSRASYDQVVDLMNTAKRLRRRATSSLKTVADLDETAVADAQPQEQHSSALQDALRSVENVESQARMLVGRFLEEEERLEGLKARIRQEVLEELLDVVNAFVEPGVYQRIRRKLLDHG